MFWLSRFFAVFLRYFRERNSKYFQSKFVIMEKAHKKKISNSEKAINCLGYLPKLFSVTLYRNTQYYLDYLRMLRSESLPFETDL